MTRIRADRLPPWASFLDGTDLEHLPHKRLQRACKKARVSASGSSDALRAELRAFCDRPPEWWAEEQRDQRAKAARVVKIARVPTCERALRLTVGQRIEFAGDVTKCFALIATLGSATPPGCLVEKHKRSQRGARSGFIGGPIKDTAVFSAEAPGTAAVLFKQRRGASSALSADGAPGLRVTIVSAGGGDPPLA